MDLVDIMVVGDLENNQGISRHVHSSWSMILHREFPANNSDTHVDFF